MDTADVKVTVQKSKFYAINKTHRNPRATACTPATFTLLQPAPQGISQVGDTLVVKKADLASPAGIKIRFDLKGSGCTPTSLNLQRKGGTTDRKGTTNFPPGLRKPDGADAFIITDIVHNHGPAGKWVWSISIPVQDSAGVTGVLDPDVENQD